FPVYPHQHTLHEVTMHKRIPMLATLAVAAVVMSACPSQQPQVDPTPVVNQDSIDAARAREEAERARREAEARAAAEREAAARAAREAEERAARERAA